MSGELLSFLTLYAPVRGNGPVSCGGLFTPIASKLLSSEGPLTQAAPIPCVLCQEGANAIDLWLTYCPVVHSAWLVLWKGCPPPVDWRSTPNRHTGIALRYLLFHTRRLVTEHGGLRPNIECLQPRTAQRHVMDLWQRVYHSLPATLLPWFRAPPLHQDLPCTSTTQVRVQRFPRTHIDSALLPDKGLRTTRAFRKHGTIATFGSADVRLRLLLTQYRRLPFPAATAALIPYKLPI